MSASRCVFFYHSHDQAGRQAGRGHQRFVPKDNSLGWLGLLLVPHQVAVEYLQYPIDSSTGTSTSNKVLRLVLTGHLLNFP